VDAARRLRIRVWLNAERTSLADVLRELEKHTGVPFEAAPEAADIQLSIKVSELMVEATLRIMIQTRRNWTFWVTPEGAVLSRGGTGARRLPARVVGLVEGPRPVER
jgi:hypothetical protein